jgi:flagellar hook-associated protein 1 FlgK
MAFGVNSVLGMGIGALFASQANIQTVGNNISNVNTPGYSRQAVVLQAKYGLNSRAGQVGQGVDTKEVVRYFDLFVEKSYLNKFSSAAGYNALHTQMTYVESLFNESNVDGISSALTNMFTSWNKLSEQADSYAAREALLSSASTLSRLLNTAGNTLQNQMEDVDRLIAEDVESANKLIKDIADLNRQIAIRYEEGRNNPNALMDARDAKVRELAALIDVNVQDNGPGDYNLTMKSGATLVQNDLAYGLEVQGPKAENSLTSDSPYKAGGGTAHFGGTDSREYTLEIVNDASVGSGAQFKVSLDGGRTWLTDDTGNVKIFNAKTEDQKVRVGNLDIWFDAGQMATGDRFVIYPKSDVYWDSPTAGPINVSPQLFGSGAKNTTRIQGGSLGGYLEFRDYYAGEYRERLNAMSKSIAWEVNRIHSQGVGLKGLSYASGTYSVGNTSAAMGSAEARFVWADKLQAGNATFTVFDVDSGKSVVPYPGLDVFSKLTGGNFDPSQHSLEDVVKAINAAAFTDENGNSINPFIANISDGKIVISSADPKYSFSITSDTTGLAAALGINTFFTGDSAASLALRDDLQGDLDLINAGRLSAPGNISVGDNQIAQEIAALAGKKVSINTVWNQTGEQTLTDYYSTLISKIGADTSSVKFSAATETTMAQDLYLRQEEVRGVNLDEEMSNLIKFQASYKAAAKLITTADEMLQTLLGMKQ